MEITNGQVSAHRLCFCEESKQAAVWCIKSSFHFHTNSFDVVNENHNVTVIILFHSSLFQYAWILISYINFDLIALNPPGIFRKPGDETQG